MKTAIVALLAIILGSQLIASGAEKPEYLQSFDPEKGFKPAQRDLTEIFLQIAGSLEFYGSPEPYLRHIKAEHARIEAKYRQKLGRDPKSYCPPYMTDQYLDQFSSNWNALSPKLGLKPLTQDIGNMMRDAINGTRGTGTILVEIFNQHQTKVFDAMAGRGEPPPFDALKLQLITRLELDKATVDEERYEIPHRDAVSFALGIQGVTIKLFKKLDANLKPDDSNRIKEALTAVFIDVGRMAQSELEAGVAEWALADKTAATR